MPRGGRRPGAGRPLGSKDVLQRGAVQALQAAVRAAKAAAREGEIPKINARLAAESRAGTQIVQREPLKIDELVKVYGRVGDVLCELVPADKAGHVLKSATMLADALVGPQVQEIKHSLADQHASMALSFRDDPAPLPPTASDYPSDISTPASRAMVVVKKVPQPAPPIRRRKGESRGQV